MIGRLNHIAIAVADLEQAATTYQVGLQADVGEPIELPEHGVRVIFISLENTKLELISPLGNASPISGFLEKNPSGGIHHICFEVANLATARTKLEHQGARILGDGTPKIGAHGKPVLFLHPKDFNGALIELEEIGGI